ncbi:hypothetical protein MIND_00206900 [Mycena indigotica]|uniref:Uncharacterized protein n=1 Tax=Mycena indigotica TaxID=2126181 RepID=A0A8H6T558_9AGAR|nr:uncharacterized protein MIND_00206900 [Mycena indigotica]KAF7311953.1 hypothetical protein MIND_00206900 [Mycena indigotica]
MVEREEVEKLNRGYVRNICFTELVKLHVILKCATLNQVVFALNRDLALMTISTVWVEIRSQVLLEYRDFVKCTVPGTIYCSKSRCPYCGALVKIHGVSDHVVNKHPEINPNSIPKSSLPAASQNKLHCLDCPVTKRKRVFTKTALAAHCKALHTTK